MQRRKGEPMRKLCITLATTLSMLSCARPGPAPAPPPAPAVALVSGEQAAQLVAIRDIKVSKKGEVSAKLVNNSSHPLRDVRVLIRHAWLWKNERKPGDNNPSRAVYHVEPDPIAPGSEHTFAYQPAPPLPARRDGHFVTTAEVIGYSQVGD